jgi:hypothetical protein
LYSQPMTMEEKVAYYWTTNQSMPWKSYKEQGVEKTGLADVLVAALKASGGPAAQKRKKRFLDSMKFICTAYIERRVGSLGKATKGSAPKRIVKEFVPGVAFMSQESTFLDDLRAYEMPPMNTVVADMPTQVRAIRLNATSSMARNCNLLDNFWDYFLLSGRNTHELAFKPENYNPSALFDPMLELIGGERNEALRNLVVEHKFEDDDEDGPPNPGVSDETKFDVQPIGAGTATTTETDLPTSNLLEDYNFGFELEDLSLFVVAGASEEGDAGWEGMTEDYD